MGADRLLLNSLLPWRVRTIIGIPCFVGLLSSQHVSGAQILFTDSLVDVFAAEERQFSLIETNVSVLNQMRLNLIEIHRIIHPSFIETHCPAKQQIGASYVWSRSTY